MAPLSPKSLLIAHLLMPMAMGVVLTLIVIIARIWHKIVTRRKRDSSKLSLIDNYDDRNDVLELELDDNDRSNSISNREEDSNLTSTKSSDSDLRSRALSVFFNLLLAYIF